MTTWYVRPVNGSDANDGESFATAWQTTQHAINSITADTGDEQVYLVSEGVEETSTGVYGLADVTPRSYALRMYAVGPSGETGFARLRLHHKSYWWFSHPSIGH